MAIGFPILNVENTKWAQHQVSTGEIISRNQPWPHQEDDGNGNMVGLPIIGQDPDRIFMLEVSTDRPEYDPRLYSLQTNLAPDTENNVITTSYEAVKRTLEEVLIAIDNEESTQMARHVRIEQELKETRLMVGALLFFSIDLQQFQPKPLAMANDYKAKALKLWQNRDRADDLKVAAAADEEIAIGDGWADSE